MSVARLLSAPLLGEWAREALSRSWCLIGLEKTSAWLISAPPPGSLISCLDRCCNLWLVGSSGRGRGCPGCCAWQSRDIGELKGMYVVGSLAAVPVLALASVWACLAITRATRRAVRLAGVAFGLSLLGAVPLVSGAYEPVKTSGSPVLAYELRLPPSLEAWDPSNIDVTIWSERDGFGCSIKTVRVVGGRQVVSGTCVISRTNQSPTMSLRFRPEGEGHWRVPMGPEAPREVSFGSGSPSSSCHLREQPRRSPPGPMRSDTGFAASFDIAQRPSPLRCRNKRASSATRSAPEERRPQYQRLTTPA
jgi:hypothetical protein